MAPELAVRIGPIWLGHVELPLPKHLQPLWPSRALTVDIDLPGERIAIEYDGVRWHDPAQRPHAGALELRKLQVLEKMGYRLVRVRVGGLPPSDAADVAVEVTEKEAKSVVPAARRVLDALVELVPEAAPVRDAYAARSELLGAAAAEAHINGTWGPKRPRRRAEPKPRTPRRPRNEPKPGDRFGSLVVTGPAVLDEALPPREPWRWSIPLLCDCGQRSAAYVGMLTRARTPKRYCGPACTLLPRGTRGRSGI